jgi:hypothetical protein
MPLYHVEGDLASADDLAELSEIEKRNLGQVFDLLYLYYSRLSDYTCYTIRSKEYTLCFYIVTLVPTRITQN